MLCAHRDRFRWNSGLLTLLLWVSAGCGENAPVEKYIPADFDAAVLDDSCVDDDDDGFGSHCALGPDCDDSDDTITDLCFRCALPLEGCPCEPRTEAIECVPPPYRGTDDSGESGTYRCSEGTRYCAMSKWGPCQALTAYFFVPD